MSKNGALHPLHMFFFFWGNHAIQNNMTLIMWQREALCSGSIWIPKVPWSRKAISDEGGMCFNNHLSGEGCWGFIVSNLIQQLQVKVGYFFRTLSLLHELDGSYYILLMDQNPAFLLHWLRYSDSAFTSLVHFASLIFWRFTCFNHPKLRQGPN